MYTLHLGFCNHQKDAVSYYYSNIKVTIKGPQKRILTRKGKFKVEVIWGNF